MIVFAREVFVCKCPTRVPDDDPNANELARKMNFVKGSEADLARLDPAHHDPKHVEELRARLRRGEHWMVGEVDGQIVTYTWLHGRPQIDYPYLPNCSFHVAGDVGYGYDAWTPPELRGGGLRRRAFLEELHILERLGRKLGVELLRQAPARRRHPLARLGGHPGDPAVACDPQARQDPRGRKARRRRLHPPRVLAFDDARRHAHGEHASAARRRRRRCPTRRLRRDRCVTPFRMCASRPIHTWSSMVTGRMSSGVICSPRMRRSGSDGCPSESLMATRPAMPTWLPSVMRLLTEKNTCEPMVQPSPMISSGASTNRPEVTANLPNEQSSPTVMRVWPVTYGSAATRSRAPT